MSDDRYVLRVAALAQQGSCSAGAGSARRAARPDYSVAVYTVRMRRRPPNELLELNNFDGKSRNGHNHRHFIIHTYLS